MCRKSGEVGIGDLERSMWALVQKRIDPPFVYTYSFFVFVFFVSLTKTKKKSGGGCKGEL